MKTPSEAVKYLIDAGMSESRIGRAVGVSQATVHRIKFEKAEPSWFTGQAIIAVAKRVKREGLL